jgi:hypothetical protein
MRAIPYFAWAVTLALCAGLLMGQATRQGRRDPGLRQIRKPYSGQGKPPEPSFVAAPSVWTKMSFSDTNAVLAVYGLELTVATEEFTLTPKHPMEGQRGRLVYSSVSYHDVAQDSLQMTSKSAMDVVFPPIAAGKPHLVMFSIVAADTTEVKVDCGQLLTFPVKPYVDTHIPVVVTPTGSTASVKLTGPSKSFVAFHDVTVQLVK